MNMPWKAVRTSIIALAAANAAQAVSIQDFFNDAVISSSPKHEDAQKVRAAGMVLSLNTEAFRSAQAGVATKAECIYKNFLQEDSLGHEALDNRLYGALTTNKSANVEDYVVIAMDMYCPSGGGAQVSPRSTGQTEFTPTLVTDFYKRIVPDNGDKITVLNMAIRTQAARIKLAGDEDRAHCVAGLAVNPPTIPPAFRTDIMQELSAANRSGSSTASVEDIVIKAIAELSSQV